MKKQLYADLSMLLYALIMGATSLVLKIATQELSVFNFLALRFLCAFLICFILFFNKWKKAFSADVLKHSAIVGVVTFGAYICCTSGVSMTPVGVAGFLTSLQTIVIPLIGVLVLHRHFSARILLCVAGTFVSVCLITLGNHLEYGAGVWLCLASSVLAAVQILLIEKYVNMGDDAISLTVWQLGVMAICAAAAAVCTTGIQLPDSCPGWLCVAWTAVISTAFATYIQTRAQRYTSAVHTGVIFSTVPVFSLIGGRFLFSERFTPRAWAGAALMVFCVICMELNAGEKDKSGSDEKRRGEGEANA